MAHGLIKWWENESADGNCTGAGWSTQPLIGESSSLTHQTNHVFHSDSSPLWRTFLDLTLKTRQITYRLGFHHCNWNEKWRHLSVMMQRLRRLASQFPDEFPPLLKTHLCFLLSRIIYREALCKVTLSRRSLSLPWQSKHFTGMSLHKRLQFY